MTEARSWALHTGQSREHGRGQLLASVVAIDTIIWRLDKGRKLRALSELKLESIACGISTFPRGLPTHAH